MIIHRKIKKYILSDNDSIKCALEKMTLKRIPCVFAVSHTNTIAGVLTDADFRGWLLNQKEIDLNQPVSAAMNTKVIYASENESHDKIMSRFSEQITHIPLLDYHHKIIGICINRIIQNQYEQEEKLGIVKGLGKIELMALDVDGVLTDGSIYCSENGEEMIRFSRIDGKGIERFRKQNRKIIVISSEDSNIVRKRLEKLNIDYFLGIKDKLTSLLLYLKQHNISIGRVAFMGDDVQDLEVMNSVGFSFCPADAQESIKKTSKWICKNKGGRGAVREAIELILKMENSENECSNRKQNHW